MNKLLKNLKDVLKEKNYLILFLIFSIGFIFGSYYLTIYRINSLDNFFYVNGFKFSVIYLIMSFLISISLGLYLTLFLYKYNCLKKVDYKYSSFGFLGLLMGALGTGCAGCSITLLSLIISGFGATFGLASLPFKGLELKTLGLFFLLGANVFTLNNLNSKICKK